MVRLGRVGLGRVGLGRVGFVCLILFFTSTQQSFSYAGRISWVEPVLS